MNAEESANYGKGVVVLGVDVSRGEDYTHFTIYDNLKETVLYSGSDPEEIRKYAIDSVQIDDDDIRLWSSGGYSRD